MELAITVDAMEPFAKATYALEGDGALAVTTYECVSMLYAVISTEHYPNVNAIASELRGVARGGAQGARAPPPICQCGRGLSAI